MKEILGARGVRLVFLNACDSGRNTTGSRLDFNRGVAQALIGSGLHCVVANQFSVLDFTAMGFAKHLYWELARGESIGAAAREARIAVNYSMEGENLDWAVPVVYARRPYARLSNSQVGADASKALPAAAAQDMKFDANDFPLAASSRGSMIEAAADDRLQVLVWDMEGALPQLDATLKKLNAMQDRFAISLVDLGAPLGSLQRTPDGRDVQLYANAAEQRLRRAYQNRDVDYLICITPRQIMFDDDNGVRHWNNYGWWPDEGEQKYAIASVGMDGMPRSGIEADRGIANLLALSLMASATHRDTHEAGDKACPFYTNAELSLEVALGHQKLDRNCRRAIAVAMGDELPAIEKILGAFHVTAPRGPVKA